MSVRAKHPLAGQTVRLRIEDDRLKGLDGAEFRVEDWWQNVAGRSWMVCDGNPACMMYGIRAGMSGLPTDDEVVYGKVGAFGRLVHQSEILVVTVEAQK